MPAPEVIHRLVDQFQRNYSTYKSNNYNETQLRQEFLNPFFEALGWDVANKKGWALQYREVIHEDRVEIDGSKKAPDYAFRVGGVRKFFVEAKKPAENIERDASLAYQLRRYAWNAHLPLSILTDFEEFAVYDCRNKPKPDDSPATSRIMMLGYKDYVDRWDEIVEIFSRDAILRGDFDRYAEDNTSKRGTIKVDDAFLADIEAWRLLLARNIALRNPQIEDERQLNFAVQMTIDRIIFLRICEDRQIEEKNQLFEISQKPDIYANLIELFYRADLRYNSGLFHFKSERRQNSEIDSISPTLVIDDKVLKEIIGDLYYPSPYIFNEIPVEILGQVYEQFLGKVIRLTAGHRAKVEEKPEVRKAGGVYYTPKYIVDYIVENTVGELVKGKTPKQVAKLSIVDPACGSGSFLLGAFQYLLNWHEKWYLEHSPENHAKGEGAALAPAADGGWQISTAEKKRILLNNIYGVDIDPQAVEVTKLSLLLKVLEGETGQLSLGFERVLPDLGGNIQCGNSLIGPDYYDDKQLGLFGREEMYRINAFDWQRAFPTVFAQGGFDAVIGNPPYVRQEMLGEDKIYFKNHYKVFNNMADLYSYFIEKGMDILKQGGIFSIIVANKWMRANYGKPLKKWMKEFNIEEIIDFDDLPVFKNATTYPCIIKIINSENNHKTRLVQVNSLAFTDLKRHVIENGYDVDISLFNDEFWTIKSQGIQLLLRKLLNENRPLSDFIGGDMFYGIKTGLNSAFIINSEKKDELQKNDSSSSELLKPCLLGKEIKRYSPPDSDNYLIFIPKGWTNDHYRGRRNPWILFQEDYPAIANHLESYKTRAEKRYDQGDYWWELRACDYYDKFENGKITWGNLSIKPNFYLDFDKYYINAPSVMIASEDRYLLAILNSKISFFIVSNIAASRQGGFYEYKPMYVSKIPIHKINMEDSSELLIQDRLDFLVNQIIDLNKIYLKTDVPNEKKRIQRQITATDAEIDRLVYELYDLTEDEIRIVEESVP